MTTFMPPPPAATYLAFHPQDNNIIAVGMDDSTILIYNVRVDEVTHIMAWTNALVLIEVKIWEFGHFLSCCRLRANLRVILKESLVWPSHMCSMCLFLLEQTLRLVIDLL